MWGGSKKVQYPLSILNNRGNLNKITEKYELKHDTNF